MSSTWKELKAIELALNSFAVSISGKALWHTDNQNCMNTVLKGSTKAHLQTLALSTFSKCFDFFISLNIVWIPRMDNYKVDNLSNVTTTGKLLMIFFKFIDSFWGPHTVDRFASADNVIHIYFMAV